MRIAIPAVRLRLWHLIGLIAAGAAFLAVFRYRDEVEDPGYRWIRQLRSYDAAARVEAAGHLGSIRPPDRRAVGPLLEALSDGDARVRGMAARSLMYLGGRNDAAEDATTRAALTAVLGDPDRKARGEIALALAIFSPEPGVIVPTLIEYARDGDARVRGDAVDRLGLFARRSGPARAAVLAALDDDDFQVRWRATLSLLNCVLGPDPAPEPIARSVEAALVAAADDEHPIVRMGAIEGLGRLGDQTRDLRPRVIDALADPAADVRAVAVRHVGARAPRGRPPALVMALAKAVADPDERVRRGAVLVLGGIGLDAEPALPALRGASNAPDEGDRRAIAGAIRSIELAAEAFRSVALPRAIAELGDADAAVRSVAADRLGDFGPKAAGAVAALVRCLGDREPIVRRGAANALGRIGLPAADLALPSLAGLADADEVVRRAATLARSALLRASGRGPTESDRAPSRGGSGR